MSAILGVAASDPLLGALMAEHLSWRLAFGSFAIAGVLTALSCFAELRGPAAMRRKVGAGPIPPFPVAALRRRGILRLRRQCQRIFERFERRDGRQRHGLAVTRLYSS